MIALERAGVSVGTGSALRGQPHAREPRAGGDRHAARLAEGSLRLTLGQGIAEEDVDYAAGAIADAVRAEMERVGLTDAAMAELAGGWR